MKRYVKKRIPVEAVKVPNHEWADNPLEFESAPDWLREAVAVGTVTPVFRGEDYWYYDIVTLEGTVTASPDDMIIKGYAGEIWPIDAAIFRATYEEWDENETPDL